ncbi:MAG: hypothetical protein FJY75_02330, partial [Candidatus Eisenbacteria bacterium]|nr:hypothetical protein [Candidatus Eisenbacteria bacterium]
APGGPVYRVAPPDAEMDALRSARQARAALRDSLSLAARERHAEDQRLKKLEARQLRLDWRGIDKPPGPEAFAAAFHFPPRAQYATGTCWAFSATSFIESEVERLNGRRVKLSEMWLVYWEYVEKARRFVREYGRSAFGEGSQDHALQDIYARYGAVPADAYRGCPDEEGRHDHTELAERLDALLSWVEERACWEEALVVDLVRSLLDEYLGVPPEVFDYEGRTHTPPDFLRDVLALDLDAYVSVVSTLREPFGEWTLLDVHDNWRRREDFLNLPLPEFYRVLREAAREGCTAVLGVDVSEPGMDGLEDAAVVPSWDIPAEFIDQFSRELRIANRATTDDHGNHCVGHLAWGGRDWFLIKDSNRSSRQGRFPGYAFYDGDYIRLKALCFTVHRDRLAGLLPEAPPPR